MRIALFSGNYNYLREGANQTLNRLVRFLEARGDAVRVYSPVTNTPAFEPAGTLVPVPSITLPVRKEFRLALGMPAAIRRDVEAFAPDLIHLSTPDILNTRALSFARKRGIPVVASQHTLFETYLDHYGLGWARPLAEAHLARFYRRCSHVLVPMTALIPPMEKARGDSRVSLFTRGIDRARFDPARRDPAWRRAQGIGDHEVAVLFFGRLVLEKGVHTYVTTLRALLDRGLPVRPLVIGAGPAEAEFRELPGVVLAGHLEGEALSAAVASADMMLHASTTEAFGNVLLEAMASGLPVVCTDCPSARTIFDHGRTGLITPPGDIAAHAALAGGLVGDPALRQAMGRAAREESALFDWNSALQAVADTYDRLVGDNAPAQSSGICQRIAPV